MSFTSLQSLTGRIRRSALPWAACLMNSGKSASKQIARRIDHDQLVLERQN
jgi:hypothetical protein